MTWKCRRKDYHKYIDDYIDGCRSGKINVEEDILLALDLVEEKLDDDRVFIDTEKIEKAAELMERYFEVSLFDWELAMVALVHCYYEDEDMVVFDEFILLMGRGNGKNGFISMLSWYFTTHYHGIKGYNVEIIANSQDQAETSFNDVFEMLEDNWTKLRRFFDKTKQIITNKITRSYIKFNTSNARTKDGKRSACLIFDEIHEYENYDMINVFTSGFGKKKHSRTFIITTNGHVRDGVLDDKIKLGEDVLKGIITNIGLLPLFYRIKKEEDVLNKNKWHCVNPSLKYRKTLKQEMEKHFTLMKYTPPLESEFYTKRMNFPKADMEKAVVDYEYVKATNKEIPDLVGKTATVGIDYAMISDMASVNIHFRVGEKRYDINHSWLCLNSKDIKRIKAPYEQWATEGKLTLVDKPLISPFLITEYIAKQAIKYNIKIIYIDNFRYALFKNALESIGFDATERKNVKLVKPSDIMKVVPVIEKIFIDESFHWGDNPPLRWAVNNTKLIPKGKKEGEDTGNYYYGKIEAKSRKTDPFMALVASMIEEAENTTSEILENILITI